MIWMLDSTLAEIGRTVGDRLPETGGALFGIPNKNVVCAFLFDEHASATGVSYVPSIQLVRAVAQYEQRTGLQYKGIIHSHPEWCERLSSPDLEAIAHAFDDNPHMAFFFAPLLLFSPCVGAEHELPLGRAKILSFVARRTKGHPRSYTANLAVRPEAISVIPLRSTCVELTERIGGTCDDVKLLDMNGHIFMSVSVTRQRHELLVMATESFPLGPPLILETHNGTTTALPVTWDLSLPVVDRFLTSLRHHSRCWSVQ